MSSSATEHTEVIVKAVLTFLRSELSIFPKFVAKGGGISGGSRLARVTVLMALVLFVVVGIAGIVTGVQVTSFLIGLVFVRLFLIGFTLLRAGFLAETLIVTGVDGVRENLHGFESGQLALLSHNIFDLFSEAGLITVMEDGVIPAGLDSKTVELDIVLHDVLIVLHLEIVNSVFRVGSGIDGAKLGMEGTNEGGPIIHPVWSAVRVEYGQLEILQSSATEEGQCKGYFWFIIVIGQIVTEIEVA